MKVGELSHADNIYDADNYLGVLTGRLTYNGRSKLYINYFDYGYCISVHKSQGSEWDKVILFEQRTKRWDDEFYTKWLYTAVSRAKHKLLIIGDAYI